AAALQQSDSPQCDLPAGADPRRSVRPSGRSASMPVIRRPPWDLPERLATPESVFMNRRAFLGTAAGAVAAGMAPAAQAQRIADLPAPTKDLYPAKRNEAYTLDRALTDEKLAASYNNFYEFGTSKSVARAAQALKLRPWTIKIDG